MRGLGAVERDAHRAVLSGSRLQRRKKGRAEAAKPRARRDVVQRDLAGVPNAAGRQNRPVLYGNQKRTVRIVYPGRDIGRRLVGEPALQDFRIVVMVGCAQLRDRSSKHIARLRRIRRRRIANDHAQLL
jgi:hypothetical protein